MTRSPRSASRPAGNEALGWDQQGLDFAFRRPVHQRCAPGKLTDLGQELTCALLGDGSDMAQAVALGDRNKARQHDEHAGPDFSRFEELLPVRVFAQRPVASQSIDFLVRQGRKRLLVPWSMSRVDQISHTFTRQVKTLRKLWHGYTGRVRRSLGAFRIELDGSISSSLGSRSSRTRSVVYGRAWRQSARFLCRHSPVHRHAWKARRDRTRGLPRRASFASCHAFRFGRTFGRDAWSFDLSHITRSPVRQRWR